jgi:hypothetical protein
MLPGPARTLPKALSGAVGRDTPPPARAGVEMTRELTTERDAVALVAERVAGGLRFYQLRHSCATWLVTAGVPVNITQKVMGHENPSTTLGIYTHTTRDYGDVVRAAFNDPGDTSADELPTFPPDQPEEEAKRPKTHPEQGGSYVETRGLEPLTPALQRRCSAS